MSSATAPIAIISPVRDESALIEGTIQSMLAQTVRPREWLFVDDGSTDNTAEIVERYAAEHPFIRLIKRADRGKRVLGSGVIAAFDFGKENLQYADWEFICKLDGDMSFDSRYVECMLEALAGDPKLAAVSGKVFRPEEDGLVEEFIIDEMVAGQFKFYRREAFEQIGGFEQSILWDGIDIHRCRMQGWTTRSFHHDDARLYHHRLMGSSDSNVYKGRVRLGKGIWFMGYHPLYALASGMFRMHEKPYVIGGVIIFCAYCWAAIKREPRYHDKAFRRDLASWQLGRLKALPGRAIARLTGGGR